MHADLDRFYSLLARLALVPLQGGTLATYTGRSRWPTRGVYFFQEPGEYREARDVPRIVRVGTHAVSANSKATLWGRLRTHRGDRAGGGSHRSSVFRRHIGAAVLARDGGHLPTWGVRSSASSSIRSSEALHEQQVSAYRGAMSVLWVDIPDEPGPRSARAFVERNAIALLSNHFDPFDRASPSWLGLQSPHREIRASGLWNLDYVDATYDDTFLDLLENCVTLTCSRMLTAGMKPI